MKMTPEEWEHLRQDDEAMAAACLYLQYLGERDIYPTALIDAQMTYALRKLLNAVRDGSLASHAAVHRSERTTFTGVYHKPTNKGA